MAARRRTNEAVGSAILTGPAARPLNPFYRRSQQRRRRRRTPPQGKYAWTLRMWERIRKQALLKGIYTMTMTSSHFVFVALVLPTLTRILGGGRGRKGLDHCLFIRQHGKFGLPRKLGMRRRFFRSCLPKTQGRPYPFIGNEAQSKISNSE